MNRVKVVNDDIFLKSKEFFGAIHIIESNGKNMYKKI
jgi:hypothetical protein